MIKILFREINQCQPATCPECILTTQGFYVCKRKGVTREIPLGDDYPIPSWCPLPDKPEGEVK